MQAKFCPYCGLYLGLKEIGDEGLVPYCNRCQRPIFDLMYPCIIVAVFNEKKEVCLIKQSYGKDNLRLISGFVQFGHTFEETIKKEVKEEIGYDILMYEYVTSFFQKGNDNLMAGFIAMVKESQFRLSKEVKAAGFYKLDEAIKLLDEAKIAQALLLRIKEVGLND